MMVLVDTPVWSLALRRRPENLTRSGAPTALALRLHFAFTSG